MPIVLVVDDSEVDRRLVGGLLSRDIDWLVEYAENGQQALEMMQVTEPDVVVTDLMMPDMDGMELVTQLCMQYPSIPIILVTGQGSEETAAEALARGAVSYVPKSELSEKLAETVEQVLALERADSHYDRLIGCLTEANYSFELDNDPALIPPLVDLLQQMLMGMRCCDTTTRMHAGVALEEALLNAMLHGNLELTHADARQVRSRLRQGAASEPLDARRRTEPFSTRRVRVRAEINRDRATFTITDDGGGFDLSRVPADRSKALESSSGRGLILMNTFMDRVDFNEQGNEVTLVLECNPAEDSATDDLTNRSPRR